MTWEYNIGDGGSSMDVYDHEDTLVDTVQNDGSGLTIPDDVLTVMRDAAEQARAEGDMKRWRDIHIRMAADDIAEREV